MDLLKNLDNMITAEDFYDKKDINGKPMSFNEKMIEFAKFHVEEALKQASENVDYSCYIKYNDSYDYSAGIDCLIDELDKNSILNAYSLENIK